MELNFEGREAVLQEARIKTKNGGSIPIILLGEKDDTGEVCYSVGVDGVEWFITDNVTHGVILFRMMSEHITEYMHYVSTGKEVNE